MVADPPKRLELDTFLRTLAWQYCSKPKTLDELLRSINSELIGYDRLYDEAFLTKALDSFEHLVEKREFHDVELYVNKGAKVVSVSRMAPKKPNWKSVVEKKFPWLEVDDPRFSRALKLLMETDKDVCLVGPGGSGKSSLVQLFTAVFDKTVVLATTGAGAEVLRNAGVPAVTIHSFFRLPPHNWFDGIPKETFSNRKAASVLKACDAVIIDETSMLSSNTMEVVLQIIDKLAKKRVRVILVGDPLQLPPVVQNDKEIVSRYEKKFHGVTWFFGSPVFQDKFYGAKLTKIYRQADQEFADALSRVRVGEADDFDLKYLSLNVKATKEAMLEPGVVVLCSTNAAAKTINDLELARLPGSSNTYETINIPHETFSSYGFRKTRERTPPIELKVGSLVMCTINYNDTTASIKRDGVYLDEFEYKYYKAVGDLAVDEEGNTIGKKATFAGNFFNGSIGTVTGMGDRYVEVILTNGTYAKVGYTMRYEYEFSTDKFGKFVSTAILAYDQLALIPARAITKHKAQGHTFDRVHVEVSKNQFAHGILYVALSRVRTLAGLSVDREITSADVTTSREAIDFLNSHLFEDPLEEEQFELE